MQHQAPAAVLQLRSVDIRYGSTIVVTGATFDVEQGEFVTLLGPSGSGKTSLLRTIAGFVHPSAGTVRLRGRDMAQVPPYERDIGMVFQNYALFPHMTIADNLGFGPRMKNVPRAEIDDRVRESLAHVRLERFAARYPHELSGGQQQRVAIARALALRPSVILLDEPMSNLDARLRAQMRVELVELLKGLRMTAVAVTHNQEEALAMSDRIVVMAEGGIRQVGTPGAIYDEPHDTFVANFVGDANLLTATHDSIDTAGRSLFRMPDGQLVAVTGDADHCRAAGRILVRPEAVRIDGDERGDPARDCVRGTLVGKAFMGAFTEYRASVGGQELLVKVPAGADPGVSIGQPVRLSWLQSAAKAIRA